MSIGPLNEILVSITNIILKSAYAQDLFMPEDVNDSAYLTDFDRWQEDLLQAAEQVHNHWTEDNDLVETGLDQFESTFSSLFPSKTT